MAEDTRTYIRVHDGLPDHPKVDALSDKAFRLLIETWCWCSRHLTDGEIPRSWWTRRSTPAARRELVNAGLILDEKEQLRVHDYLQHQRSKAEVAEVTTSRRTASLKANHTRWHTGPKGRPDPTCGLCGGSESDPLTDPKPDRTAESDRTSAGLPIGIGIGIGIGTVPPSETLGGRVPDSTARDTPTPPNLDPNNPRCGRHAHVPADDPGPACRACRDVRLQLATAPDPAAAERAAFRAAVDACGFCDDRGMREFGDGLARCDHRAPLPAEVAS